MRFSLVAAAALLCFHFSTAEIVGRPTVFLCPTLFSPINVPGLMARDAIYLSSDIIDWHRDFGTKFFLDSDSMWKDREYLSQYMELATPKSLTTYKGLARKLLFDFRTRMNRLGNGEVLKIVTSGTLANNLMILAAKAAFMNPRQLPGSPEIIYFKNPYGGSFGESYFMKKRTQFGIEAPFVSPNSPVEFFANGDLTKEETAAIDWIRRLDGKHPIAGIFIEPFAINSGLKVYRPVFLTALRFAADELKIPILADEILSGGGRTGNFWSYQYAPGFVPDLVTFGKGLVVAGVFEPRRHIYMSKFQNIRQYFGFHGSAGPPETLEVHPIPVLQSIQVLKVLEERDIMSQIQKTSLHMYTQISKVTASNHTNPEDRHVFGMVLGLVNKFEPAGGQSGYFQSRRNNPPLTLTPDQFDAILGLKPFIYEDLKETD